MRLRDYFAGLAMQAMFSHPDSIGGVRWATGTAEAAYAAADAMLAAREPKPVGLVSVPAVVAVCRESEPAIEPLVGGSVSVELDQPSQPQGE